MGITCVFSESTMLGELQRKRKHRHEILKEVKKNEPETRKKRNPKHYASGQLERESPSTEKTTKKDSIDIGTDMIHLVNKWCKLMVPINTVQYCKCMFFYDFLNNIFFPLAYFESVR